MALLSEEKRKEYFKELGLGEYNKTNILKMQKKYMYRKTDWDGVYGTDCDNLLRHLKAVKDNCTDFAPEEFHCGCNGKYCCGYPNWMRPVELKNIQKIRSHFGKPMVVTCGLRCTHYNQEVGGIARSEHLFGLATDYYIQGVTDTLANRKQSIKWISKLPNHSYTYGNGIYVSTSDGSTKTGYISARGMGNAMHTDSKEGITPKPTPPGKITVDGIGGPATVKAMQKFFCTTQDGVISGQNLSLQKKYYPSLTAVKGGTGGSPCIKNLQRWVGTTQDGVLGQATVKALQKKLGIKSQDGIWGSDTMKFWQEYLNTHDKPVYPPDPKPKIKYKVIDVSNWQGKIDWKKVKADGVVGAIIRYADGTDVDSRFQENMKGAKAAGLHIGAYLFSRAKTKAQAEHEATILFNACKPYNCDMPLYIDLEDNSLKSYANTVANAFIAKMKALGGYGGVYANLTWWNNYLTKVNAPAVWVAQYYKECQYKGSYGMWQYSSSGSVNGISGRVDMDWCYVDYWNKIKSPTPPKPTPGKEGYKGKFPEYKLVKTNAEVIADAIEWAKRIAKNDNFHYGYGKHAHHNGCQYCDTQYLKKGHGIKEWETTYCCNAFVGAAWAHGGGDAQAYKLCHNCNSWGFAKDDSPSYESSSLFDKVSLKSLKAGDVLCSDSHVALYIGNGKVVQAGHEDDNKVKSAKWNDSIAVGTWDGYKRAYRYNGKVNANRPLERGELSDRVADLQKFLIWYGKDISVSRFFNTETFNAVKEFQKENGLTSDGIVGEATIAMMKTIKK